MRKKPKKSPTIPDSAKKKQEATSVSKATIFSGKNGLYVCLGIIALICLFVFRDFIFLNKAYLFKDIGSDSVYASWPQYINISEHIRNYSFPFWSFHNGIGQNIFAFIFRDPTDIFAYLSGKTQIPFIVIFKELLKIVSSGIFFYLFLKKTDMSDFVSICGGVLYAFSGFMILGSSGWYIFTMEALTVSMLLYAFELMYKEKRWHLFPIVIMLISISMPFNLYIYGIFILIYTVFRLLYDDKMNFQNFRQIFSGMLLSALLGFGISAMFSFSNILQLVESPRVSGGASLYQSLKNIPVFGFSEPLNNITSVLRFFSSDIMGTANGFRGWNNYLEAPLSYCGLITLLLIPQLFSVADKKKKLIFSGLLLLWILPMVFPYLRHAFWLFTGDYYRSYSLIGSVIFLIAGLNALNRIINEHILNVRLLIISLFVCICILYYPYLNGTEILNKNIRANVVSFLVLYSILLYLLKFEKIRTVSLYALLLCIFIEMVGFSDITVNKRIHISSGELKQKSSYNDFTTNTIQYLNTTDTSFYRIDKDYSSGPSDHISLNDPQAQLYNGTTSYNSFNQLYYIKFLQGTTVIPEGDEEATRWCNGLTYRPYLESFCSVKYFLSKQKQNPKFFQYYDSLNSFGDVTLYRNKSIVDQGLSFQQYILNSDYKKLSALKKDLCLFKAFVINDMDKNKFESFIPFDLKDTVSLKDTISIVKDLRAGSKSNYQISLFSPDHIKGKMYAESNALTLFTVPYDKGWSALMDEKEAEIEIVDFGFIGVKIPRGNHSLEFKYRPPYLISGIIVSLLSLIIYLYFYLRKKAV